MACTTHSEHAHEHSSTCGHKSIRHDDHVDYIHDGHLHHMHGDHADEHVLSHEAQCTPDHSCGSHDSSHTTAANAVTKPCHMETTLTIWWVNTCTAPVANTATTTAR